MVNVQEWLDKNYPKEGICLRKSYREKHNFGKKRKKITKLDIKQENLEGKLNLNDFINLKKLNCESNKLTGLDLTSCEKLEKVNCCNNLLNIIAFPTNPTNLKKLNLTNNPLPGNLDFLVNFKQLKYLDISDTDFNEVNVDKLPKSLEKFNYSNKKRPDCKLVKIIPQLDKHFTKFGLCLKCQQFNTSKNWCQSCQEKKWQENIKNLVGKKLVKKSGFDWISYWQFTNIKYLAEGGFSKIYEAQNWLWDEKVVLKSLNNSQNITLEFLREIANAKLVRSLTTIPVYGISQNPKTKNYVMVMKYVKDGNLRKYLQDNHGKLDYHKRSELGFKNKFSRLSDIVYGLSKIHEQNLVHRDLHSGNILNEKVNSDGEIEINSYITDLGLSYPANCQPKEGEIFGVFPYIAPEVLRGRPYTQASDIYSFGIVAYELFANSYPYPKMDGTNLALKVCQGLRPNIDKVPLPQLLKDLIKKCWDVDPKKRPNAGELGKIFNDWCSSSRTSSGVHFKKTPLYHQYQEIKDKYNIFSQNTPYQIYPAATLTSKPINTKKINELSQKFEEFSLSVELNLDEIDDWLKEYEEKNESNLEQLRNEYQQQLQAQIEVLPKRN